MNEPSTSPPWRFAGGLAWLVLFGTWFVLAWVLGRVSDVAYLLSIEVARVGPTALFCFLFVRHGLLHAAYSRRELLARLGGNLIALVLTGLIAREVGLSYDAMDDAPRGLLWDFNIVVAPLLGLVASLFTRLVIHPGSVLSRSER